MMRYCLSTTAAFTLFAPAAFAQSVAESEASLSAKAQLSAPPAADDGTAPTASSSASSNGEFDSGKLLLGVQLSGNLTMQSLDATEGQLGAGGSAAVEYVVMPYFKVGLEVGYMSASYENTAVTDSGSNVVDDSLNLYVAPDDLITKRGGRGTLSHDAVTVPLVLKGRYPIPVDADMYVAPYVSFGGQLDINMSSAYDVQNDDEFDYGDGLNGIDFKLLGGIGLDFSLGSHGQIGVEGRYLMGLTEAPGREMQLNSRPNAETESEYPLQFTVPANQWSRIQLLLSYRYPLTLGE